MQPNFLRNGKKEFLNNVSAIFEDSRDDKLKEKFSFEHKEKEKYAKEAGQLTMQVDWLKKRSEETLQGEHV